MRENNPLDAYNKFIQLQSFEREAIKKKVDETTLKALKEYERKYLDNDYKVSHESEKYLKEWLYLDENLTPSAPIYTQKDMEIIGNFVDEMSPHIFKVIYENIDNIRKTFMKCKASDYANFAEFFCWLYHLTFTETMDYLIKVKELRHSSHGYEYWIWKK